MSQSKSEAKSGRSTVYHNDLTSEYDDIVNKENKSLVKDYLNYLRSADKSSATIKQYEAQLRIFFVWNAKENNNVFFCDMKKRQFVKFFTYLIEDLEASSNRVSSFRAVLSSLSNYIERILDDEFPSFRNIVKVLEPVNKTAVREKTVLTDEEVQNCLNELVYARKYQVACALALLASSGMRKSELIQMKVDFFDGGKEIFDGVAYETPKIRTKGKGKAGMQLTRIVFKDPFEKYFRLWMEQREKKGINSEWLFVSNQNGEYQKAEISTANSFARTIESYMGREVYMHALRHYFVSSNSRKGFPESVLIKIMKWKSGSAMYAIYNDNDATEELNDWMASFMKSKQNDKIDDKKEN